jgi:hypothetical protein
VPFGPGKYDAEVTELRERLKADGILLVVVGGERGPGFSAQLSFGMTVQMPRMLRAIAQQIEDSGGNA